MGYEHIEITRDGHVATLWLNRPDKLNALSEDMWADIPAAMADLDDDDTVRVVILAGRGKAFSAGIDVSMLASLRPESSSAAAGNMAIYREVKRLQRSVSCLANSPKPVLAAIHGYCLGAGINLVSACDLRLASADAVFSIRETRMGLVADIGVLQRLPSIVGSAVTAEMALTGADYDATWAKETGLVTHLLADHDSLIGATAQLAQTIASNSPLVTQGIKQILRANDGRTIEEALDYVAQWNSSFLMSNDLTEAMAAFIEKRDPNFTGT